MNNRLFSKVKTGLRRLAKASLAYTAYHSGLLDQLASYRTGIKDHPRIIIVGYHRVVQNYDISSSLSIPSLLISSATLRHHFELIQKNFYCISLDEVLDIIAGRATLNRDAVVLTFDDGYQDFYDNALPLLQEYDLPATLFVPSSQIGLKTPLLHDQLYYLIITSAARGISIIELIEKLHKPLLQQPEIDLQLTILRQILANNRDDYYGAMRALFEIPHNYLTILLSEIKDQLKIVDSDFPAEYQLLCWPMIKEMANKGITIGAHTCNHTLLTEETMPVVEQEIIGSKWELEEYLKMPVRHFAYPDGRYNSAIINIVRNAGFESGCTVEDRPNTLQENPFQLKRKLLWERACLGIFSPFSNIVAQCQLQGLFANPLYKLPASEVNIYEHQ